MANASGGADQGIDKILAQIRQIIADEPDSGTQPAVAAALPSAAPKGEWTSADASAQPRHAARLAQAPAPAAPVRQAATQPMVDDLSDLVESTPLLAHPTTPPAVKPAPIGLAPTMTLSPTPAPKPAPKASIAPARVEITPAAVTPNPPEPVTAQVSSAQPPAWPTVRPAQPPVAAAPKSAPAPAPLREPVSKALTVPAPTAPAPSVPAPAVAAKTVDVKPETGPIAPTALAVSPTATASPTIAAKPHVATPPIAAQPTVPQRPTPASPPLLGNVDTGGKAPTSLSALFAAGLTLPGGVPAAVTLTGAASPSQAAAPTAVQRSSALGDLAAGLASTGVSRPHVAPLVDKPVIDTPMHVARASPSDPPAPVQVVVVKTDATASLTAQPLSEPIANPDEAMITRDVEDRKILEDRILDALRPTVREWLEANGPTLAAKPTKS